jgi:hypothetical protein
MIKKAASDVALPPIVSVVFVPLVTPEPLVTVAEASTATATAAYSLDWNPDIHPMVAMIWPAGNSR